jgi:hypothetical protein
MAVAAKTIAMIRRAWTSLIRAKTGAEQVSNCCPRARSIR